MNTFRRYAVYWAPPAGPLATFTASWLGWDAATGTERPHPALPGLPATVEDLTDAPRKYGFHGTLKPPFRLVDGAAPERLCAAVARLAAGLAPVRMEGLRLARLGKFLALVPVGDTAGLGCLAATLVKELDPWRAPLTTEDILRRHAAKLNPTQKALLDRWGYPYVMDEFRFHLTLTGALADEAGAEALAKVLEPVLAPILPTPFVVEDICIFGEAEDGRFHLLHRYPFACVSG
ncbi:DUF1045 domain-containing protein [Frigidibacter sp. MR17.14]|uniref:DUF1045 domain-containing protein n=1 Tax=Frigidibacter sp. MR17.14 TaxID=3126509 RepID=UPI003012F358